VQGARCKLKIYTLFPVPCSLYPVPYTLFPVPCPVHPAPYPLYPYPPPLQKNPGSETAPRIRMS